MREDAFSDPIPELDEFVGKWEVEGDVYTIYPSPEGGLLARSDLTGDPISPAWVLLRGFRVRDVPPEAMP